MHSDMRVRLVFSRDCMMDACLIFINGYQSRTTTIATKHINLGLFLRLVLYIGVSLSADKWHAPKYSAAEMYCKMPAYYNVITTSFDNNHEHCPMIAFERSGYRLHAVCSHDPHMHATTNVGRN